MHQATSNSTSNTLHFQDELDYKDCYFALLPLRLYLKFADFPSLPFIVSRMASLREVICQLTAIVDNPTQLNAPLEWPIPELRRCLKHCSFSRLDKWRKRVHKEYDNQIAQDLNFYVFQDDVWDCLTRASDKSHQLRLWTKGKSPTNIRFNFTSRRHLVSSALTDILEAFKHFSAMNGRPVGIVFKYIKKCYEFMIHLGSMLYPHGESDSWYSQLREYLVDAKLDGFNLNGTVVIEVAADPTFAFSILDPASMPATCLPLHPQPPMVTVTKGPYGPRLSRNLYWVQ